MELLDVVAIWGVILILVAGILAYMQAGRLAWAASIFAVIAGYAFHARPEWWVIAGLALAFLVPFCLLAIPRFRRPLISDRLSQRFSAAAPPTAQHGASIWCSELFRKGSGWREILRFPRTHLTVEEQDYIAGPVEALCERLVASPERRPLSPLDRRTWPALAADGLLGLDLPKEFGGRAFSPVGLAAVVEKIASRDLSIALCVGSPAATMARTLILEFGTRVQQEILTEVVRGNQILALVSAPTRDGAVAGRPAGRALVRREQQGQGPAQLGLTMEFELHCVELSPVASMLLIVVDIEDPNDLIGDGIGLRRAVVLVPADCGGVARGSRHDLARLSFPFGTVSGRQVNVPLDNVLGGCVDCDAVVERLADVSPWALFWSSADAAAAKVSSRCAGAMARISGMWGPAGNERAGAARTLGKMAAATYSLDASRRMTLSRISQHGVDEGLASLLKLLVSARGRRVMDAGLDIHGAAAICRGPTNLVAEVQKYPALSASLGGSDQQLRGRYVFQRSALAQHPYLGAMLAAAGAGPGHGDRAAFDRLVGRQLARVANRLVRALAMGWSGAWLAPHPARMQGMHRLARQVTRLSAGCSLTVELMLLHKGASLLEDSRTASRLSEIAAELFAATAVVRRYKLGGEEETERPLAAQAMVASMATAQLQLRHLLENNAPRWLHAIVRGVAFPFGWPFLAETDQAELQAAQALVVPSTVRDRLTAGIFWSGNRRDALSRLENALARINAITPLAEKLHSGERVGLIHGADLEEKLASAEAARLFAASDAQLLREADALRREVMAMDVVDEQLESLSQKRAPA